jgi:DnaJ-class molecular chaperone
MNKNFYDILQVNKNSTKEEIKKSYKKLALQYHPDKNKDENSIDKFKEIAEAYATLGDDDKRKNYDMFGSSDENFSGDPFSAFNDIFNQHMSSFMNMNYEKEINISDILNKLSGFSNSNFDMPNIPNVHVKFHTMNKSPFSFPQNNVEDEYNSYNEQQNTTSIPELIPEDIIINIDTTLEEIYKKQKKDILLERFRNKNGTYKLRPKKISIYLYDKELFLEKNGNENENSSLKGNIIINIKQINTNKYNKFKRINDYDILYIHEISLKEYYNNVYFKLTLPNDELLKIKNDNFQKNKSLLQKIENKGIPYLEDVKNNIWNYGDLYIQYNVKFPEIDNLYDYINEIYEEEDEDKNEDNINKYKKYIYSKNCNIDELFDNL